MLLQVFHLTWRWECKFWNLGTSCGFVTLSKREVLIEMNSSHSFIFLIYSCNIYNMGNVPPFIIAQCELQTELKITLPYLTVPDEALQSCARGRAKLLCCRRSLGNTAGRREHWISFSVHTGTAKEVGTQAFLVSCPWSPSMLWFALGAKLPHGPPLTSSVPFLGPVFWLGASRSCSGDAGRPWKRSTCPVGFSLLLHTVWLHIILHR